MLIADLTGELVCRELAVTAQHAGLSCTLHLLPSQLAATGLLAALTPRQLAGALAEAMHSRADADQADRAVDTRIIEQIAAALGGQVSVARLAAAVRVILGNPGTPGVLAPAEQTHLGSTLFPGDYQQQIQSNLVRIESFIAPLADTGEDSAAGGPPAARVPQLRCLALEPAARSVRTELLTGLLIQWLTVQITAGSAACPAVIIAGADEVTRPHLERLSDACERRGVGLTLLFRHLRETAADLAGSGTAAFMRLGNHKEATTAADLIGRHHKFVLSQLTATLGGNQTHTRTDTEGWGEAHTTTRGWHDTTTFAPRHDSRLAARAASRAIGRSESFSTSASRNWSTSLSRADGSNWSNAEATQRVYEYTVEPTTLQHLPDHALLLLTTRTARPGLTPVECDPAIITLPRVSATPLPSSPAQPVPPLPGTQPRSAPIATGPWQQAPDPGRWTPPAHS